MGTPLDLTSVNLETGLMYQDDLSACKHDKSAPTPLKPEWSRWPSCKSKESITSRELPPKAKTKSDHELTIMKEDLDFQKDVSCWQKRLLELREWFQGFDEPERTGLLAAIVTSTKFETMSMCVILLNAVFMAYE